MLPTAIYGNNYPNKAHKLAHTNNLTMTKQEFKNRRLNIVDEIEKGNVLVFDYDEEYSNSREFSGFIRFKCGEYVFDTVKTTYDERSEYNYRNKLFFFKEDVPSDMQGKEIFTQSGGERFYLWLEKNLDFISSQPVLENMPVEPTIIFGTSLGTRGVYGYQCCSGKLPKIDPSPNLSFVSEVYRCGYTDSIDSCILKANKKTYPESISPYIYGDETCNIKFSGQWKIACDLSSHQTVHIGKERTTRNVEIIDAIEKHCGILPLKVVSANLCNLIRCADNYNSHKSCINFNKKGERTFKVQLNNSLDEPFTIIKDEELTKAEYIGISNTAFPYYLGEAWEILFTIDGQDFLENKPVYVCTQEQLENATKKYRPDLFEKCDYNRDIHYIGSGWCEQNKLTNFHDVLSPLDQSMGLINWIFSRLVSHVIKKGGKFPGLVANTTDTDRQTRFAAIDRLQALKK